MQLYIILYFRNEPVYKWLLTNEKNLGGVSCLSHYDITGDGQEELLVGREDGNVEIYAYDDTEEPFLRYSHVRSIVACQKSYNQTGSLARLLSTLLSVR